MPLATERISRLILATVDVNALHEGADGAAAIFQEAAARPANALVCHLFFPPA